MKIRDIRADGAPRVSFEVFPPKKDAPFGPVKDAVARLVGLRPAFVSVTYGASGNAQANTAEIASYVQACGAPALAHLTCLASSRDRIAEEAADLHARGIENVLCLRGDLPQGKTAAEAGEAFAHAVDLVRALRPLGFCLGGACYPECHPECAHLMDDIARLKEKVEAGLDFLTTQMFFDNAEFFNFLYRLREQDIRVPVLAGIMPITNQKQLGRSVALSGTTVPTRFKEIVDKFGEHPEAMKQAGIIYATEQIIDLIANDVKHVHVYSMNKPDVAEAIQRNLSEILKI